MKSNLFALTVLIAASFGSVVFAQDRNCPDGNCPILQTAPSTIVLDPLKENLTIETSRSGFRTQAQSLDRFDQVIRATVRVTVSNVCGSGTVVGRTAEGNAIVLTNAHVAGTKRGRVVKGELRNKTFGEITGETNRDWKAIKNKLLEMAKKYDQAA